MQNFELKILSQHWIKDDGVYDKNDICSHGELFLKIGGEVLSDSASGSWSLSTAALFLLRTLDRDCQINDFTNYLIPCCGHTMMFLEKGDEFATTLGCIHGIDWTVKHKDGMVELTTERGNKTSLPFDFYKNKILDFVNEVEAFYGDPNEKTPYEKNKNNNDGYETPAVFAAFWREWRFLKQKWA